MQGKAIPLTISALSSTGVGEKILNRPCEDTITLTVQWKNLDSGTLGSAVYTASWSDPKSDVHSQQHFYCQCAKGFVDID